MKNLITDITTTIRISDADLEKISARFQIRTFSKSDLIPSIGKISNHLQFIEEGLVRVYSIDKQAKEVTI